MSSSGNTIGGTVARQRQRHRVNNVGIGFRAVGRVVWAISILGNSIHDNATSASTWASRGDDPERPRRRRHRGQPPPELPRPFGRLRGARRRPSSAPSTAPRTQTFRLEFFANPAPDPSGYGQGQTYLGFVNVTTDGSGNASFTATGLAATTAGQWVSATATAPDGSTSEFAQDVRPSTS